MKASIRIMGAAVVLSILALSSSVLAQARMPEKHVQVYELRVKSGMNGPFEQFAKKAVEAANKLNAPQGWLMAQPETGANGNSYFVFIGFDKWSDKDAFDQVPVMIIKAFGEAEGGKILKMSGDAMSGHESKIYTLDEERSWNLEAYTTARHYQILLGRVKPSMVDEYRMVISEIKEAQENTPGAAMGIRRESRYGPSWEFYMATPFDKWGDWDAETSNVWANVAKHHGEAKGQALRNTLRNCYESREVFVITGRPDLSRDAPTTASD